MLHYWTAFCQPEIPATSVQHEHGGTGEVLICTLVYSNLIDKLGTCGGAVPSLPGFVPATCITNMSSKVLQLHQTTCVATTVPDMYVSLTYTLKTWERAHLQPRFQAC
jgi:hypothetical protein